ncbi:MAG TPA: hypothetical protein VIH36_12560 [Casimicrobiaceae bacterium]
MTSAELPATEVSIDPEHPWLGLASFTEAMGAYFFGRDDEVAELARRVQRKPLTLLFGQSGLGKTSILRAGLVPRLRAIGYCPVYVRIDYAAASPPPSEQIKAAVMRATERAGTWTRPGSAVAGESLWEFFHHREDVLHDDAGRPVVPLLIFDQFEEIFTLAQGDDAGRRRAAAFVEDLADLVENRPPHALESRMEEDESVAERFDFTRGDYRVLIALREDYLAHLEALKGAMPSITQNRMRIARMTGAQAHAAVVGPGKALVTEDVAASIVRFVGGNADLEHAEVEPSLLSLICRELNAARIAQGRAEISADLLAGSRDTILTEFYERALADQPQAVRRFIEDELLTESGFRESLAEERVQKAFAAAGAPGALGTLVDRRLLRIEERLDLRRVELTHDVLCSVVRASRDVRHEREARDAAEARLAGERERQRATRRALVRARQVAAACGVLAVVAVASAIFGYVSSKRAQHAEGEALATRAQAERARGEAEKLTTFLLDDFQLELAPVGRLDIVGDLAKRALAYYDGLPAELRTPETNRNRALALVRYGAVLRTQAKLDEADKVLADGVGVLSMLRRQGDASEATAIGLATGLSAQALAARGRNEIPRALQLAADGAAVLAPQMASPSPSVALRRAQGDALTVLGVLQVSFINGDKGIATVDSARAAYRSIADLALSDTPAAVGYAEASAWKAGGLEQLNRSQEALEAGNEAVSVASRVLDAHPGYTSALRARGLATADLADAYADQMMLAKSLDAARASARDYEALVAIDPSNVISWNNLAVAYATSARVLLRLGRVDGARTQLQAALDIEHRSVPSNTIAFTLMSPSADLALLDAEQGDRGAAEAALRAFRRFVAGAVRGLATDSMPHRMLSAEGQRVEGAIAQTLGDYGAARSHADAMVELLRAIAPADAGEAVARDEALVHAYEAQAAASFRQGDAAAAQAAGSAARALRRQLPATLQELVDSRSGAEMVDALVAARQGRTAEAQALASAALARERELAARNREDAMQSLRLARALFVAAKSGVGDGPQELAEATSILARLPATLRRTHSFELLHDDIAAASGRVGGGSSRASNAQ